MPRMKAITFTVIVGLFAKTPRKERRKRPLAEKHLTITLSSTLSIPIKESAPMLREAFEVKGETT